MTELRDWGFKPIIDREIPPPSEERIQKFEKSCRVKLPEDYLSFLKEFNGAQSENRSLDCNGHSYCVERFLCLLDRDVAERRNDISWFEIGMNIAYICERLTDDGDAYGVKLVPIADLFLGDLVCLDFRKDPDNPSVCVWNHEESDDFVPVTYKVADSFTEFLNMLYNGD